MIPSCKAFIAALLVLRCFLVTKCIQAALFPSLGSAYVRSNFIDSTAAGLKMPEFLPSEGLFSIATVLEIHIGCTYQSLSS